MVWKAKRKKEEIVAEAKTRCYIGPTLLEPAEYKANSKVFVSKITETCLGKYCRLTNTLRWVPYENLQISYLQNSGSKNNKKPTKRNYSKKRKNNKKG